MTVAKQDPRILFIARNYPPIFGGLEKNAEEFYTHLQPLAAVDLLSNPRGKKYLPVFFLQVFFRLITHARKYDVIHFNDAVMSPLLPIIRLFSRAKVTFTVNGLDIVYRNNLYQALIPYFLRQADRIFPISEYTARECEERQIDPRKIRIITVGINEIYPFALSDASISDFLTKYSIKVEEKKVLISMGRLVKRKGHAWFLENVFPLLPENTVYLIGGDGPERPELEQIIVENKLESRVYLLGRITDMEKQALYQVGDLFIMPNISVRNDPEGFGIVLLEAGTYQLPVIATDIEGISSAVLDGVTGRLVREGDIEGFVAAINRDDIERQGIRQAIKTNFHWDRIARQYLQEFITLTEE